MVFAEVSSDFFTTKSTKDTKVDLFEEKLPEADTAHLSGSE